MKVVLIFVFALVLSMSLAFQVEAATPVINRPATVPDTSFALQNETTAPVVNRASTISTTIPPTFPAYFRVADGSASFTWSAGGIPMYTYDGVPQYNPVTIEQYALFEYNVWKSGSSNDYLTLRAKTVFFRLADWLVANQTSDGLWLYTFHFLSEPVPWWSAMAEGWGFPCWSELMLGRASR